MRRPHFHLEDILNTREGIRVAHATCRPPTRCGGARPITRACVRAWVRAAAPCERRVSCAAYPKAENARWATHRLVVPGDNSPRPRGSRVSEGQANAETPGRELKNGDRLMIRRHSRARLILCLCDFADRDFVDLPSCTIVRQLADLSRQISERVPSCEKR